MITNMLPTDDSIINDNMPVINANYVDTSGIDITSVVLKIEGIDVTSLADVTASGVTYIPPTLSDGLIEVYLEVNDTLGNHATATWSFTVDASSPSISNMLPTVGTIITDNMPVISAEYSDTSDIDTNSVVLEVNGIDVTLFPTTTVTPTGVTHTPPTALSDGLIAVYLEVNDTLGNSATASWSFIVDTSVSEETPDTPDTTPPDISGMQPSDLTTTSDATPTISAFYGDQTGIKITSVILKVNGEDVTSSAIVTIGGISYTPTEALANDEYTIYLEVSDNSTNQNKANVSWSFTVEKPETEPDTQSPEPDTQSAEKDFLSEYWWLILILVIIIVVLLTLVLLMIKKKPVDATSEEQEEQEEQEEEEEEEEDEEEEEAAAEEPLYE
jgi:hypothetical protein